jgi:hypothetical protein
MKSVVTFAVALAFVCSSAMAANTTNKNSQNTKSPTSAAWQSTKTMPTATTTQNGNTTKTNTTKNGKTSTTSNSSVEKFMKVSHEGFDAMHTIRAARVAIFSGQPDVAANLLNKASTCLQNAAKDAPTFVMTTQVTVNGNLLANDTAAMNMNWVPIDGQFAMADAFVNTPKNTQCIEKANRHFQKGQTKQAVEQLQLASIDVSCTRVWMSLATTTTCVNQATKLLNEQKYYQANMALKAAEDRLVIDTTNLFATPTTTTNNNANKTSSNTKVKASNSKTNRTGNVNAKNGANKGTVKGKMNANSTVKTNTGNKTNVGTTTNTGNTTSTGVNTNNNGQKNEIN